MNWSRHFAQRTACMRRSAIRELLKLGSRPGMISFAGGLPAAELFPIAQVEAATQKVLREHGKKALQYGETEGLPALREWLAQKFSTPKARLRRENVLITTGAQQGLDLLGRVFLDAGDKVVVENPTYLTALSAWRPLGPKFLPANADSNGLCVDTLEPLMEERPKLLYTIPNFQNPTGVTLATERRPQLIELVRKFEVSLVEDNPYGDLWYDHEPPASLFELDARNDAAGALDSNVVYLGTFSKILAPALRVGWVIASEPVIDKLALAKQSADLQSSTFNQYIALEMAEPGLDLPKLRAAYRERRDAMLQAIQECFPEGVRWTVPGGGLFVWVTLPKQMSAMTLLARAIEKNVTFVPGEDFHVDGAGQNTLRLNFSNANPTDIHAGIARLSEVIRGV